MQFHPVHTVLGAYHSLLTWITGQVGCVSNLLNVCYTIGSGRSGWAGRTQKGGQGGQQGLSWDFKTAGANPQNLRV